MKIPCSPVAVVLAVLFSGSLAIAQPALTTTRPPTPVQLKPGTNAPITIHVTDDSKAIYQAIAKLDGFNVLFDQDYQPKHVQIDLTNTNLSDALRIVGDLTNTSFKPLTPDTIFVFANSRQKHTDFDELETQTVYLKSSSQQADANEIVTALRNILPPESKVYLVASQNAVVMRTTPQNLQLAQAIMNDLDLPKKTYRLTYTVIDVDGSKPVSTEHYSMVMVPGMNTKLKQGSKVPIATGTYSATATTGASPSPAGAQTQFTYLDVGMNFDATLQPTSNGATLKSSIERSAVATEQSGVGPQDPILRQTSLAGVFYLTLGKPITLGSVEMPGTTHHLEVEAMIQQLP
jgi:type II secretory pathway component GspD/PulD (secretin)